jgi:integrase
MSELISCKPCFIEVRFTVYRIGENSDTVKMEVAMPKQVMPLTDTKVKKSMPGIKPLEDGETKKVNGNYKLSDGGGLYLLVTITGGKLWRFDYSLGGKRKTLAMGSYPEISLERAREKRKLYREQVAENVDPGLLKKIEKSCNQDGSFESVAREWHLKFSSGWSKDHAKTVLARLSNDVFPYLGSRPIADILPVELLMTLRRVESRGALETAHRIKTVCGQVMRYAVATGRAERDIAADLKGALPAYKPKHLAAITDPKKVGELLRAIDGFSGSFIVKTAMQLAPLVFVRPGELRQAEWSEFDLDKAEWNIPAEKMKVKGQGAHLVPLSRQSVELLQDIYPLTCSSRYVFHGHRSTARPMSENAVNAAFRRMGFEKDELTGHGFRATARTILDEILQVRPELIEQQLAHTVRDSLGRAYNRTKYLEDRRRMMQLWADYLDGLRKGAKVVPLKIKEQGAN